MQYAGHRRAVEKALDEVKALLAKERAAAEKAARIATLEGHTGPVRSVCSLGDGRLASGSGDKTVRVWAATGECVATLEGHTDRVLSVCSLGDGRLASGSWDGTVRVWAATALGR